MNANLEKISNKTMSFRPITDGVFGLEITEGPIGNGSQASITRARTPTGQAVAIRSQTCSPTNSNEKQLLWEEEKKILALIKKNPHPAIIKILGERLSPTIYQQFMPLYPYDLFEKIEDNSLDTETKLTILRKIAQGSEHIAKLKIVHRDLKPENVLLDDNNRPVITDFGAAQKQGTPSKTLRGTLAATTPELLKKFVNEEELIAKSAEDIFAFGMLALLLLFSANPYPQIIIQAYLKRLEGADKETKQEVIKLIGEKWDQNNWDKDYAEIVSLFLGNDAILNSTPNILSILMLLSILGIDPQKEEIPESSYKEISSTMPDTNPTLKAVLTKTLGPQDSRPTAAELSTSLSELLQTLDLHLSHSHQSQKTAQIPA